VIDVAGRALPDAEWSVSNRLIATLQRDGDTVVVRGLGPGSATIGPRSGQVIAEAQFTVSPYAELPHGTTRWTLAPVPGFKGTEPIYTHPTPGGPDIIAMEREVNGRRIVLKATTAIRDLLSARRADASDI
jgi:hypothetical protein